MVAEVSGEVPLLIIEKLSLSLPHFNASAHIPSTFISASFGNNGIAWSLVEVFNVLLLGELSITVLILVF